MKKIFYSLVVLALAAACGQDTITIKGTIAEGETFPEGQLVYLCDGKTVHVVGIPLHWGFTGAARKGFGPNSLTPFVGDANTDTPEFKAFLVNVEPSNGPAVS